MSYLIVWKKINQKNFTNLLSAEFAKRVEKVKVSFRIVEEDILKYIFLFFSKKAKLDISCALRKHAYSNIY